MAYETHTLALFSLLPRARSSLMHERNMRDEPKERSLLGRLPHHRLLKGEEKKPVSPAYYNTNLG